MLGINFSNVDAAGNYPKPKAGGYVIRITRAENNMGKERTEFEFDFAEGEFKDYYQGLQERAKFWGGKFSKSYKEKARPFYRGFVETILASNAHTDGLVIGDFEDIDETKFVGKLVGMVVGEKAYIGNDGKEKVKLDTYNAEFVTVDAIRSGDYTVPAFIPLEEQTAPAPGNVVDTTAGFGEIREDDMPF